MKPAEEDPLSGCNFNAFLRRFAQSSLFEKFQENIFNAERQARELWSVDGIEKFQVELAPPTAGRKSLINAATLAEKANSQFLRADYEGAHARCTEVIAHLDHPGMLMKEALEGRARILASWGMEQHSELDSLKAQSLSSAIGQVRVSGGVVDDRYDICYVSNNVYNRAAIRDTDISDVFQHPNLVSVDTH
jgi:hypothetical protein